MLSVAAAAARAQAADLAAKGVRLTVVGERAAWPRRLAAAVADAEAATAGGTGRPALTVCLGYGARGDAAAAARTLAARVVSGDLALDEARERTEA